MFNYQTYPASRRELIILDDSPESNQSIIDEHNKDNNVKYIYSNEKIALGKKRNMLNDMAKGEYIVCFDDDDFYAPERIRHSINKLKATKALIGGCSLLYIYYSDIKKIYSLGPFGPRHGTAATFAYHRSILKEYRYDETAEKSEEKFFLKDYSAPLIQFDTRKVMLCIAHGKNTCEKRNVLQNTNIKLEKLNLKDFTKDKYLLSFYENISKDTIIDIDPKIYSQYIAQKFKMPDLDKYKNKKLKFEQVLEMIREKNTGFPVNAIEYFIKTHTNIINVLKLNNIIE